MAVRVATISDIEKIALFAQYFKCKKKLFENSTFKLNDFKGFLLGAIRCRTCRVFVSDHDGDIRGFIVMSIDRVPWNRNQKWGSDVLFAAEKDAAKLCKMGIEWCKSLNCWKIFMSNSTGYEQADKFYELMKLRRVGGQFEYVQP